MSMIYHTQFISRRETSRNDAYLSDSNTLSENGEKMTFDKRGGIREGRRRRNIDHSL